MAEEKILTINLRKELVKKPRWKKRKEAVAALKEIIKRRTRSEEIKIGKELNEKIWSRERPPTRLRLKLTKEENITKVDLMK